MTPKHSKNEPKKIDLEEGTARKYEASKESKGYQAVWVKKATLNYEKELLFLQEELMKLQRHIRENQQRLLILLEGRDAAGKGGLIKRITQYLNPRGVRVVALGKPSDTETTQWYFQRYVPHLPAGGEIVLFDRSWYNRAMVEPVMGFCSDEQNKRFLKDVPLFEQLLVKDGINLVKFYMSISRGEQNRRFESRKDNPLKQYKFSPVDAQAQERWDDYTIKKFQMLSETNRSMSPWTIVRSDKKKAARINAIKALLSACEYEGKTDIERLRPDSKVIISGIDELKHMEENLMNASELMG